ncbi:hypothetical protein C8R43DRAFT_72620 [Mycena crocata]|nr:hypothetical protein C8R43DRAFT_72620 [Mycena crocata]
MHESLSLTNLKRLPVSTRRVVDAVCVPLSRFVDLVNSFPLKKLPGILPIFHQFLDPARVPSSQDLDTEQPSFQLFCAIQSASMALRVLFAIALSLETGEDLWPRLWIWAQFILLHHDYLKGFDIELPAEEELHIACLTMVAIFCIHTPNRHTVTSTPGFYAFCMQTWACLLRTERTIRAQQLEQEKVFDAVCIFISDGLRTSVEEIIAGAGGNIHDLAVLVMRHVTFAGATPHTRLLSRQLALLNAVFNFVDKADTLSERLRSDPDETRPSVLLCSHWGSLRCWLPYRAHSA